MKQKWNYAEVAAIYIKGGGAPTAHVASELGISKAAAAKCVARARSRGLLPETTRGVQTVPSAAPEAPRDAAPDPSTIFAGRLFATTAEVAQILRCDRRTVHRGIEDGTIPAVRIGDRVVRIPIPALLESLGLGSDPEGRWSIAQATPELGSLWERATSGTEWPESIGPDTALEEIPLSLRTYNVLKRAGMNTAGDVLAHSAYEISQLRNIGTEAAYAVVREINAHMRWAPRHTDGSRAVAYDPYDYDLSDPLVGDGAADAGEII